MDRFDALILRELARNGRATQAELGDAAGLSPTAAARRMKALEDNGLVTGYRAEFDLARLGYAATVMVHVTLASQSDASLEAFERAVMASPSVLRCHLVSGHSDYFIVVMARSLEDYERIHRKEIASLPGVSRVETAFALRQVVDRSVPAAVYPLPAKL